MNLHNLHKLHISSRLQKVLKNCLSLTDLIIQVDLESISGREVLHVILFLQRIL
jgi:hypothetical protein